MVKSELVQNGALIRHYTDDPHMGLLQTDTGRVYEEAVDVYPTAHTYEEIPMEHPRQERGLEERVTALEKEVVEMKGAM